ncbi:hypothetical protein CJ030_MR3G009904 [Morella rubra]|uniref:Putative plant transposon protein domain-containing protein n=1 Tax=Morella rubra TaxID=262757 RepID=A0A6A1W5A9_9ROSI|nr:hypothetical protein CJ030_MR3G009904 [Morella rubra]
MASYDITLRGVSVTFSADKIREFLGIARPESPSYPDQGEIADCLMLSNSELYKLLTGKEEVLDHLPNIPHSAMTDFFRMLHLIVTYNIDPRRLTSEASFKRVKLMVYIVKGVPVDLPSLIFQNIMKEADSFEVSGVPYGLLLTNFWMPLRSLHMLGRTDKSLHVRST